MHCLCLNILFSRWHINHEEISSRVTPSYSYLLIIIPPYLNRWSILAISWVWSFFLQTRPRPRRVYCLNDQGKEKQIKIWLTHRMNNPIVANIIWVHAIFLVLLVWINTIVSGCLVQEEGRRSNMKVGGEAGAKSPWAQSVSCLVWLVQEEPRQCQHCHCWYCATSRWLLAVSAHTLKISTAKIMTEAMGFAVWIYSPLQKHSRKKVNNCWKC